MTGPSRPAADWRTVLRRWQRPLVVAYSGVLLLGAAGLLITPIRLRLLQGLEHVADALDRRWDEQLAQGEALVAAGRFTDAGPYLERLDRRFPAPSLYAGRDMERERLLLALARSYEGEGRSGRALAVYQRLAAFDPRNYRDQFELASAHARLDGGWAVPVEAAEGYRRVLALHPNHLPSVRGLVEYHVDRGEFAAAIAVWEAYRDGFALHGVIVHLGDSVRRVNVPIDGRPHDVRVTLPRSPGWFGDLAIETIGFSVALSRIALTPRRLAGRPDAATTELPQPTGGTALISVGPGRWRAEDTTSAVRLAVPRQPAGVTDVWLRLSLFKPVDIGLWHQVEQSYRNRLDDAGLAESRARTVVLPSAAAADRVEALPG